MSKRIQLAIADPCHENWDEMTAADQGRFCGACQKQVIDFTNMSDAQVAAFFKKPSTGSICGRFYDDQLGREIEIPKKRMPWVKYFFQFALPALLFSMKATAQGKAKASIVDSVHVGPPQCSQSTGSGLKGRRPIMMGMGSSLVTRPDGLSRLVTRSTLTVHSVPLKFFINVTGTVTDEKNNPVPYASVIVKGTNIGVEADSSGNFKITKGALGEEMILVVSSVGFEEREVILEPGDEKNGLAIQLATTTLSEVTVVAYPATLKGRVTAGMIVMTDKEKQVKDISVINSPTELPAMIKVYPNPVASGTSINVGCQKLTEGYYYIQLSNQSGQQVLNKQTWIDGDMQVLNIDIPHVATGVYFLRLTNKNSGKRFTQKITIE